MQTLILVDIQNDFTPATVEKPEGSLAVPDGNAVIEVANRLMPKYDLVVATQDWHPPGHKSFASEHPGRAPGEEIEWQGLKQMLWPDHCVQGTFGAELCAGLNHAQIDEVVRKGMDINVDSYSGFYDNGHRRSTGLADLLRDRGAQQLDIIGLALDVCVKFTALDAAKLGFRANVLLEGCRAVEMKEGDREKAIEMMQGAGVRMVEQA